MSYSVRSLTLKLRISRIWRELMAWDRLIIELIIYRFILLIRISAMLAGGGATEVPQDLTPTSLESPQRLGSVAVGQTAGRNLNLTSSTGDELFSQAFIASDISHGVDLVCPIFVHCPKVAGDRSLRVDAHYNILTKLPDPSVKMISWRLDGSITLLTNENISKTSSELTLTRCVKSKRVQFSVTPPFEMTTRLLSLKVALTK